jgi:membrane protein DedA with SNARE-associated domain
MLPPAAELANIGQSIANRLDTVHGPIIYVLCGLLVAGEASLMLGFVIPGETAALVGGALAGLHHANLFVMLAVVIGSAIIGDSIGFEVGKHLGPWLLKRRPLHNNTGVDRARDLIERRGGPAVFLGRWVALARALVPGVTGMSGLRYRTFLLYNALGAIAWGTTFVMIGFVAGKSYERIASAIGRYALVVVGLLAVVLAVVVVVRRRRERHEAGAAGARGSQSRTETPTADEVSQAGPAPAPVAEPHSGSPQSRSPHSGSPHSGSEDDPPGP